MVDHSCVLSEACYSSIAYRTGLDIDGSDETQIGVELFVKCRVFRVGRIIIALC